MGYSHSTSPPPSLVLSQSRATLRPHCATLQSPPAQRNVQLSTSRLAKEFGANCRRKHASERETRETRENKKKEKRTEPLQQVLRTHKSNSRTLISAESVESTVAFESVGLVNQLPQLLWPLRGQETIEGGISHRVPLNPPSSWPRQAETRFPKRRSRSCHEKHHLVRHAFGTNRQSNAVTQWVTRKSAACVCDMASW